ncbi:formin-like protein 14 [Coturnix japonica]|uniref:formin-like protein 14 n=1 Tax=Coturnix japonica TaxID=93934 RepID=UPI0013A5D29F|nr:formin-like protein 14 [Coturnix japonica]
MASGLGPAGRSNLGGLGGGVGLGAAPVLHTHAHSTPFSSLLPSTPGCSPGEERGSVTFSKLNSPPPPPKRKKKKKKKKKRQQPPHHHHQHKPKRSTHTALDLPSTPRCARSNYQVAGTPPGRRAASTPPPLPPRQLRSARSRSIPAEPPLRPGRELRCCAPRAKRRRRRRRRQPRARREASRPSCPPASRPNSGNYGKFKLAEARGDPARRPRSPQPRAVTAPAGTAQPPTRAGRIPLFLFLLLLSGIPPNPAPAIAARSFAPQQRRAARARRPLPTPSIGAAGAPPGSAPGRHRAAPPPAPESSRSLSL